VSAPLHPWLTKTHGLHAVWIRLAPWKQRGLTAALVALGVLAIAKHEWLHNRLLGPTHPGSPARKSSATTPTTVASDDAHDTITPHQLGSHTGKVFSSLTIADWPAVLEKKRLHALESDLADAMRAMPMVADACVRFDERVEKGLAPKRMVSANVILKLKSATHQPEDDRWLKTIRTMVAGSYVGLREDDIRIVDLTSGNAYTTDTVNDAATIEWNKQRLRRTQESHWEEKICEILRSLQEEFDVSVTVNDRLSESTQTESSAAGDAGNHGEIVAAVFLKRDLDQFPGDPQWQRQYETLMGTLQSLDPRMKVSIFAVPRDERPAGSALAQIERWFQTAQQHDRALRIAAAGLVLASVWGIGIVFRRLQWKAQLKAIRVEVDLDDQPDLSEVCDEPMPDQELIYRVESIVRENPDAAAKVIQSWVRKAG